MKLTLTSPVEGKMPGDTVDVPDPRARWLIANGYARVDDDGDHRLDTSVEAASDPTLAANREAPGTPPEHLSNEDDGKSWSEKVVAQQEHSPGKVAAAEKIVPGGAMFEQAAQPDPVEEEAFDPAEHTVAEVEAYLADADEAERERVLEAERAGEARRTLVG